MINKVIKVDILTLIGLLMMFLAVVVLVFYFYKVSLNKCTENPLVYGAKQYTNQFGEEFVGYGYFLVEKSPQIVFNSENITFLNPY